MALTRLDKTGDGTTTVYNVNFDLGYLRREFVYVYLADDSFTNQLSYTWINNTQIELDVAPENGVAFHIRRVVPRDEPVNDYEEGAILREDNLDDSFVQSLMILQEITDGYIVPDGDFLIDGDLDMLQHEIKNCVKISGLEDAIEPTAAVPLQQLLSYLTEVDFQGVIPLLQPRQQGDGVTVTFATPATQQYLAESFLINIDAAGQRPYTDFTVNNDGTVTFDEAPPNGADIDITLFQPANVGDLSGANVTATGSTTPRTLGDRFADTINVKDFGITGTITSPTQFAELQAHIVNSGMKNVRLVFPEKLTFNNPVNYLTLDGLENLVIDGFTCDDIHDYESTGNFTFTRLLDLTNCKNVSLTNMVGTSTLASVEPDGEKKGLTFVRLDGCDTFTYSGSLYKGYRPFEVWNTKVLNVDSYAEDSRYNAVAQEGCGVLNMDLVGVRLRRDFYIYGCTGANITVDSTDPYGHSPMVLNVENNGEDKVLANVNLYHRVRDSRTRTGSRIAPVTLNFRTLDGVVGSAAARNINIVYDVEGQYGTVIDISKYKGAGSAGDTQARGYTINNLKISGRFITRQDDNTRLFNWDDTINWYTGDYIQKVEFDRLTVISKGGYNFVPNIDRVLNALSGDRALTFTHCLFNNGVIESPTIDYGKLVFWDKTDLRDYSGYFAGESRKTLSKKDWMRGTATSTGISIKIAQVDNERSWNFTDLVVKAHSNAESLSSAWKGSIDGYIAYDSSSNPVIRTTTNKSYENAAGVLVNPVLSANSSGEIFLELPEWTTSAGITDAEVWLDFDLNYTQYSNIDNPNLVGLYSNKYDLPFGAGY